MKTIQNLILVAGSGQNVGKTFLIEQWIKQYRTQFKINAIKTSSHFHPLNDQQLVLVKQNDLLICEENDLISSKDSSRFIKAGANRSFYIQCTDASAADAANWLISQNNQEILWIVESYSVGEFLIPGMGFYIEGDIPGKTCSWNFPYTMLTSKQILLDHKFPAIKLDLKND